MTAANRKRLLAQMLDVKMTETDIEGRFSPLRFLNVLRPSTTSTRRRASTACAGGDRAAAPSRRRGREPEAGPRLARRGHEELLGEAELNPRDPEDGLLMYDNSVAGGGTPMTIDLKRETINGEDVTKQRIGAKIAFSGNDSVNCADPVDATAARQRRHTDPRLRHAGRRRAARRRDDSQGSGQLRRERVRRARQRLLLDDLCQGQARRRAPRARVRGGGRRHPCQRDHPERQRLRLGAAALGRRQQRWETTGNDRLPIELGAGTRRIDIEWSQNKNTLNLGGPTPTDCASPRTRARGSRTLTRRSAATVPTRAR